MVKTLMNENFKINEMNKNGVCCIYVTGQLDAHTAPVLEEKIRSVIDKDYCYNLLFNFNNLEYISSAGLGVFMSFLEEVRENNGDIKFSNLNERVYSVIELLGFDKLFDVTKTEDEAIEKFSTSINEK